MKRALFSLIGLAAFSVYAVVPSAPELHASKYTMQVVRVKIPADLFTVAQIQNPSTDFTDYTDEGKNLRIFA